MPLNPPPLGPPLVSPQSPDSLITASRRWQQVIVLISILVPVVVAVLIYLPSSARIADLDVAFLPHLNAALNTATALCLMVSLPAILAGRVLLHKSANLTALGLSAIFLVSYVIYHYTSAPTKFGDVDHDGLVSAAELASVGSMRLVYVVLLLSHIALAAIVLPFVLFSTYYSLSGQYQRHKRLSRITWPIWFYVSVTGVIVYAMIRPYYS